MAPLRTFRAALSLYALLYRICHSRALAYLGRLKSDKNFFFLSLFLIPWLVPLAVTQLTSFHVFNFRYTFIFAPYFLFLVVSSLRKLPRALGLPCIALIILINSGLFFLSL